MHPSKKGEVGPSDKFEMIANCGVGVQDADCGVMRYQVV